MFRPGLRWKTCSLTLGDGEDRIKVLDRVGLTVQSGEFAAVVGPSGSGKSSLLAIAGALSLPDSGTVRVGGEDVTALKPSARARHRLKNVGFVFQSGNLIPSLTAGDQLRMVNRLARDRAASARIRCWKRWAWLTAPNTGPASSPAVNVSASASPGNGHPTGCDAAG